MNLLRGKRLKDMDKEASQFTSSAGKDSPLLEYVIKINLAHLLSLYSSGIIDSKRTFRLIEALRNIPKDLKLDTSLEDVHMNVEYYVLKYAGVDGGYLNLGKSRNDQVATTLRLTARRYTLQILEEICSMIGVLLHKIKGNLTTVMPGYTHLQPAQPTSLAHYFSCYAEAFLRDSRRFQDLYDRINLSPMGSAALAGTNVPIDRRKVADLLGFDEVLRNTMDAVSTRDFLLEFLSDSMIIQTGLSRMAEDLIFYSTQEAGYLSIPDELASTSSMMPQKKNPVVLEMIRAKAAALIGMLTCAGSNVKALPQSYNLDVQDANSLLWEAGDIVVKSIRLMAKMIMSSSFNEEKLMHGANLGYSYASDIAELICLEGMIPFREAHHIVGSAVSALSEKTYNYKELKEAIILEAQSRGFEKIEDILPDHYDAVDCINNKRSLGSPNPIMMEKILIELKNELKDLRAWIRKKKMRIMSSERLLTIEIKKIEKEVRKAGTQV